MKTGPLNKKFIFAHAFIIMFQTFIKTLFPFFFITNKENIVPNWLRFTMIIVTTVLDLTLCIIVIRILMNESYERTIMIISNRN